MNIYFSGSISGGRHLEHIYAEIANHLEERGHNILSLHVARSHMLNELSKVSPQEIYTRDINWVIKCDRFIAEVSTPSLGVGYEVCFALQLGKPVLCIYDKTVNPSQMILGNTHPNIQVSSYLNLDELRIIIDKFTSKDE